MNPACADHRVHGGANGRADDDGNEHERGRDGAHRDESARERDHEHGSERPSDRASACESERASECASEHSNVCDGDGEIRDGDGNGNVGGNDTRIGNLQLRC